MLVQVPVTVNVWFRDQRKHLPTGRPEANESLGLAEA